MRESRFFGQLKLAVALIFCLVMVGTAGYRLIEADAHVARAELVQLAGNEDTTRRQRYEAIAICETPDRNYAWAKQYALALLK